MLVVATGLLDIVISLPLMCELHMMNVLIVQ